MFWCQEAPCVSPSRHRRRSIGCTKAVLVCVSPRHQGELQPWFSTSQGETGLGGFPGRLLILLRPVKAPLSSIITRLPACEGCFWALHLCRQTIPSQGAGPVTPKCQQPGQTKGMLTVGTLGACRNPHMCFVSVQGAACLPVEWMVWFVRRRVQN